jgi:hypothetical protein
MENWKNIKGKESKKDKSTSRFSMPSTLFKPFQNILHNLFHVNLWRKTMQQ